MLTACRRDQGDSLGDGSKGADLKSLRRGLQNWLPRIFKQQTKGRGKARSKGAFKDMGQVLPIGKQADTNSCGVCVINAMAHVALNAPLFTHSQRNHHRIRYFVDMVGYLLDNVSGPFLRCPWD